MRRSWTRPLSTIGSSVNLDPALQDRQSRDPKPGLGLYALRALALALAENPAAAAKFIGNRVVQSNSIDIGIAVEAEDGIMVPVIRSADKTSLADLTTKYKELIELARQRRISPDMQAGGIATVSNFGIFGMEWGTPIPLPDQTLLLGLGMGKKVPSWDEAKNAIRPQNRSANHFKLRSSQRRRRRRQSFAKARDRTARKSERTLSASARHKKSGTGFRCSREE